MSQIKSISKAVREIIKSESNFSNIIDNAEIVGGSVTGNPISILKGLNKGIESGGVIANMLFYDKLTQFLFKIEEIPYEDRIKFINKYVDGKENNFERRLIEEVNSIDDSNKIGLLSNAFKAMVYDKIDVNEFCRISSILRNTLIEDIMFMKRKMIDEFESKAKGKFSEEIYVYALSNTGLMRQCTLDANTGLQYEFTDFAYKVMEYVLTWGEDKYDGHFYKLSNGEGGSISVTGVTVVFG
ncbi:MAG: hypothetical protein SOY04_15265 [Clostridium celatum]|nr:hypothetical protein [Clostridium celatum]